MGLDLALLAKILSVIAAGAIEIWVAVPAGLALGLHPAVVAAASATGGIVAVLVVSFLGDRLRARLLRSHRRAEGTTPPGIVERVWARYGAAGLGLVAPLLVGAPVGTAVGIALGTPMARLRVWMSVGVIAWSSGLAAAGAAGLEVIA